MDHEPTLEEREQALAEWEARVEIRETAIAGLRVLCLTGVVIAAFVLVGVLVWTFVEATKLTGGERLGLLQAGIGAIAGIGIAVFAGWRAWALDQQVRQGREQLDKAEQRFAEESRARYRERLDDRFQKAVELIGSDQVSIRTGGLLALERLMRDDLFRHEHWTIVQLLESFVREKCAPGGEPRQQVPQDAQVALTILGRRPLGEEPRVLNLSKLVMTQADLRHARLEGTNFTKTELEGADFTEAQLEGADFTEAKLERAEFWNTRLEGTTFRKAQLKGAAFASVSRIGGQILLVRAHLKGADFTEAELEGIDFWGVHLEEADFTEAKLDGASFPEAKLDEASFWRARLKEADFTEAKLRRADFTEAKLIGAIFAEANLEGANFKEAKLEGAKLTKAELGGADFTEAELEGADFTEAKLEGSIFMGATGQTTGLDPSVHPAGRGTETAHRGEVVT